MKTIDEIRRNNLNIAATRAGSATLLAKKAGISLVYLSRLKNCAVETRTGNVKTMGARVARKIEVAIGEPVGWMDTDHSKALVQATSLVNENVISPNEVATLFQAYFEATSAGRKRIMDVACREVSGASQTIPTWIRPIFDRR